MKTIKHATKSECPSVIISMDAEQMLFRTSKEGFYGLAQSEFIKDGIILGMGQLLEIDVEPESVEDFEIQLRVFAVEYSINTEGDIDAEDNEVIYVISEDLSKRGGWNISINGQEIDDKVFDEEMVMYRYVDRVDLIEDIQRWLCEARQAGRKSDALLMDQDIDYLKTLNDNYVFSSIETNEYVAFSNNLQKFNEICEEIIEANNSIKSSK